MLSRSLGPLLLSCLIVSPTAAVILIPPASTWEYFQGFSEASTPDTTAWRGVDFTDSGWPTGPAAFFYENNPASANAFTGNARLDDMFGGYTCVFLRRPFVLTQPPRRGRLGSGRAE